MANTHMKRCPTLLVTKELEIKVILRVKHFQNGKIQSPQKQGEQVKIVKINLFGILKINQSCNGPTNIYSSW